VTSRTPDAARRREMYLTLTTMPDGSSTSVAVPWDEAWTMDRDALVKLYRKHVYKASKREAREWADAQIAVREAVLNAAE